MNNSTDTASATLYDVFESASWNQPRSITQLRSFISTREDAIDVEDFDL